MRIEEVIKQKEFRSEAHKAMVNLIFTSSQLLNRISDVTENYGITRQQYNVLRILRGRFPGAASVNEIKDRMLDRMSDCSRLVDRLSAKGLIQKSLCPTDKRSVDITISNEGLDLLERMEPAVATVEDIFTNFTQSEVNRFNEMLDRLRND
jgi:DNA-binding MarR family transcriptional regulator